MARGKRNGFSSASFSTNHITEPFSQFSQSQASFSSGPPSPTRRGSRDKDIDGSSNNNSSSIINSNASHSVHSMNRRSSRATEQPLPENISTLQNTLTRSFWGIIMIALFCMFIFVGPLGILAMAFGIQTLVFREVINIAHVPSKEKKLPWFRTTVWYFLFATNYFLYGESLLHYWSEYFLVDAFLSNLALHHRFISYSLYIAGLVFFVLNLKKGHYKFQFGQFGFTHMTLIIVVIQSHFIVHNIFEGMFWFVLPVSLVVCNDITAYFFGKLFGRTRLIRLSPKKTWEGFAGAFVGTVIFSVILSKYLAQFPSMICPIGSLSAYPTFCTPNPVFILRTVQVPPVIASIFRHLHLANPREFSFYPVQLHALVMAIFSSLIAPFGGFFASGFKRAFKVKDFGDSIPGHGGITDRMDCQFIMGLFSYLYFTSFIKTYQMTMGNVLQLAISHLNSRDLLALYSNLQQYLIEHELLIEPS